MSYSMSKVPDDVAYFPEPPLYAVWVEEKKWLWRNKLDANGDETMNRWGHPEQERYSEPSTNKTGQIRHMSTLVKARTRVRRYTAWSSRNAPKNDIKFDCSWTIAKWIDGKYEVIYQGTEGTYMMANSLFDKPLPKGSGQSPTLKEETEAALASVHESLRNVAS